LSELRVLQVVTSRRWKHFPPSLALPLRERGLRWRIFPFELEMLWASEPKRYGAPRRERGREWSSKFRSLAFLPIRRGRKIFCAFATLTL
jgi:hypothetical protein